MKANDFIQILEYMKVLGKDKASKPKRSTRKKPDFDEDVDLAEVYLKLNAREQRIKNAKEQIEKMMKKEDKKDDKKSELGTFERAFILTTVGPFIGVLAAGLILKGI